MKMEYRATSSAAGIADNDRVEEQGAASSGDLGARPARTYPLGMKRIVLPVLVGLVFALPAWSRDVHALGARAFQEVSDGYLVAFVDRMGTTLGCW